ncbi:MAG: AmmeMemoRadiSam system protein B [Alphaproteobacteria bacterium]|nr:AmmeMemoRadiSam system protein B [Alphaproteobacteria bacterium]
MAVSAAAIRKPAVAGMFYPGSKRALAEEIAAYLAKIPKAEGEAWPKALIAPHAGTIYSGPIAASAYARLAPGRDAIRRVVLLGPAHRLPFRGIAAPEAAEFETPLGRIPIDRAAIETALAVKGVGLLDAAFDGEHSLEVHLPFLQTVLGDFSLAPFVVGRSEDEDVAALLEALWGGRETVIVVSSDLTHYLDYATAHRIDRTTARAIERLEPEAIGDDQACGRYPVKGLLALARRRGMRATTLDLRNSGDTAGDKSRVVGYGAWAFEEEAAVRLGDGDRQALAHVALESLKSGLAQGRPAGIDLARASWPLRNHRAVFVTLTKDGSLRGCIGSLTPEKPLAEAVAEAAFNAGFRDPRFQPLAASELDDLDIEISILSAPSPIAAGSQAELLGTIEPGRDGLILQSGRHRATFLPDVWKSLAEPRAFLAALRAKAGMSTTAWPADMRAWRYRTEAFVLPKGGR